MKIDRLIGILSILLQKGTVTAPFLAEKFEVSRRTISRDIEALCKAGIPLVTAQGRGGGISIMNGYSIDRTLLTSADMQAILTGLKSLDSVSQTNRYRTLMDKIHLKNPEILEDNSHIIINLGSWYRHTLAPKVELIQKTMEPYLLVFQWSSWYVWGYCMAREDFRLFKLNQMQNLSRTGVSFLPRETPHFSMETNFSSNERIPVTARFSPKAKWRLMDDYGPDSFTEAPDGSFLFSFEFFDKENLFSWLLSFRGQAEMLTPVSLREEFSLLLHKMAEKHDI